jgi:hypothetical protein
MTPLPVWIGHLPAQGDGRRSLHELTLAEGADAVEPPVAD